MSVQQKRNKIGPPEQDDLLVDWYDDLIEGMLSEFDGSDR